ncbi:MAG: hypothetical protein GF364_14905, partial [Candidatus Lokiarchaeota archaeon]|nr:hypothetical protein [Candidatus Lokiarchaeota archaeon]
MDRILLEYMLSKMKKGLKQGEDIGNIKIGALFALGSQLEAIFYFVGHELGSKFDVNVIQDQDEIIKNLVRISEEYNLGKFILDESSPDHITFTLDNCNSCRDFPDEFQSESPFCSFEAGVFAGIVERMTNKHCFAQELACKLQKNVSNCQFM